MNNVTHEFKAAMFTAYSGCKVWEVGNNIGVMTGIMTLMGKSKLLVNCSSNEPYWSNIDLHMPVLTPLREMLTIDRVEVVKMVQSWDKTVLGVKIDELQEDVIEYLHEVMTGNCATHADYVSGQEIVQLVDFLRSSKRFDGSDKPVYDCGFRHVPSLIAAEMAKKYQFR